MAERLQCRLEEGGCRLIGRKLNRLVAGLAEIVHRLLPQLCWNGDPLRLQEIVEMIDHGALAKATLEDLPCSLVGGLLLELLLLLGGHLVELLLDLLLELLVLLPVHRIGELGAGRRITRPAAGAVRGR